MKKTYLHLKDVNTPGTGELFKGCQTRYSQNRQEKKVLDAKTFMHLATLAQECERTYGALYMCFKNSETADWLLLETGPGKLGIPWSDYDQKKSWSEMCEAASKDKNTVVCIRGGAPGDILSFFPKLSAFADIVDGNVSKNDSRRLFDDAPFTGG